MPRKSIIALATLIGPLIIGCASRPGADGPMYTVDPDLEGFKRAVAFPSANTRAHTILAQKFMATGRDAAGLAYFTNLAERYPDRPAAKALAGLFHARTANDVGLLKRIGWIEQGLALLDEAVASEDPLSRMLRGIVCAELPTRFERTQMAIDDLHWVLERIEHFPDVRRAVYVALARARTKLGEPARAADAWRLAGFDEPPTGETPFTFSSSWTRDNGFLFTSPPELVEAAPGIWVAQGYDFGDIAFIQTTDGVVAIDAGTSPQTARAALEAFRQISTAPISHILVTHAHWDHIGGLSAYLGPDTKVVANARYKEELRTMFGGNESLATSFFWPYAADVELELNPDVLISERTTLEIGDRSFVLIPVVGGETVDALLIHDAATGSVFTGDIFMPYFGAPFIAEGSADDFIETLSVIRSLAPERLIHGHTPLTLNYPVEVLAGLQAALQDLRRQVLEKLHAGRTVGQVIRQNIVPDVLADEPDAVPPFFVMRDHFIERLYRTRNGYWSFHESSWEPFAPEEWAAVLDLVSGNSRVRLEKAAETLLQRGDIAMALQVSRFALSRYPDSTSLKATERESLARLRFKHQATDPFRFILYSGLGGQELPPLANDGKESHAQK